MNVATRLSFGSSLTSKSSQCCKVFFLYKIYTHFLSALAQVGRNQASLSDAL